MRLIRPIMLVVSLALLIAAIGYFYPTGQIQGKAVPCSDITQGCGADGWRIRFDRQPQLIKPFGLRAQLPEQVQQAHVRFAMQGMEMGLNRYRLLPAADGSWTAEIILPICVRGRHDWVMQLELKTSAGEHYYQLPFTSP